MRTSSRKVKWSWKPGKSVRDTFSLGVHYPRAPTFVMLQRGAEVETFLSVWVPRATFCWFVVHYYQGSERCSWMSKEIIRPALKTFARTDRGVGSIRPEVVNSNLSLWESLVPED